MRRGTRGYASSGILARGICWNHNIYRWISYQLSCCTSFDKVMKVKYSWLSLIGKKLWFVQVSIILHSLYYYSSSKRLSSSFNRMLACLAVMDNVFLLTCFIEALRSYMVPYTNIHQLMFTYFFYPLQSISLMCSNNATVVLALERYY